MRGRDKRRERGRDTRRKTSQGRKERHGKDKYWQMSVKGGGRGTWLDDRESMG